MTPHVPLDRVLTAALRAVEHVLTEREAEMGDAALPDTRALIRDIRAAIAAPQTGEHTTDEEGPK